jgi:hypothetical protein
MSPEARAALISDLQNLLSAIQALEERVRKLEQQSYNAHEVERARKRGGANP